MSLKNENRKNVSFAFIFLCVRGLPMRLAYDSTPYSPGHVAGGCAHSYQFIKSVARLGHKVMTFQPDRHPDANRFSTGRFKLLHELRQCDVLCFRIEQKPSHRFVLLSPLRYKIIGSPIVVWEFNTAPEFGLLIGEPEGRVAGYINEFKRYANICDLAICVSNKIAEYVREKIGVKNVITIPNGSAPDLFSPNTKPIYRAKFFSDNFNVVWLGSAGIPWVDFDMLRQAAHSLWNRGLGSKITIHIIGHGENGIMIDMPPNVIFQGSDSYENIPAWLSWMDIGLVAYKSGVADYSSPLKLYDYMSSGLTVVSTEQPQVREVFEEMNQLDLIVPYGDGKALADLLEKLSLNPTRVKKQGELGRKLVLEKYNWLNVAKKTMSEIEKIANERSW